ncbi:hypothetical protein [Paraburkholderia sediminicola]|uniref:hypothetical protein n=1 Tax=Paraburkholderia sediminicola TaxID=458836 RepID=UPI0038B8F19E
MVNVIIVLIVFDSLFVICNVNLAIASGNPGRLAAAFRVPVEAALAGFRLAVADAGGYNSGSRHSRRAYKETDE